MNERKQFFSTFPPRGEGFSLSFFLQFSDFFFLTIYTKFFTLPTRNKTEIPTSYELKQNYPNPFNSSTNVQFQMVNAGRVKLVIYDILGREVKVLVNELRQAGVHKEIFDAGNLSSGVYFLRIIVNEGKDFVDVKKMVLVR